MGKAGQLRKKRRQAHEAAKLALDLELPPPARTVKGGGRTPADGRSSLKRAHEDDDGDEEELEENLHPDADGTETTHVEAEGESTVVDPMIGVTKFQLATTMQVLMKLESNAEALRNPAFKPLRTMLFKLTKAANDTGMNAGATLSGKISQLVSAKFWKDTLVHLQEMESKKLAPKLGALQRWVRDCDAANSFKKNGRDRMVLEVLDGILRVADPELVGAGKQRPGERPPRKEDWTNFYDPWAPPESKESGKSDDGVERLGEIVEPTEEDVEHYRKKFKILAREEGAQRRPPNRHPMILYISEPGTIDTTSRPPSPLLVPVPTVPSAFMIRDLFSAHECSQMLRAVESVGFTADEPLEGPDGGALGVGASVLARNVFWLADSALMETIEDRIRGMMPEYLDCTEEGGEVVRRVYGGINPRWRVYRYVPGHVYRAHIDGAWPRSGVDPDTNQYVYDVSKGMAWSRMTFLIYLNQNFKGGETTFFLPSEERGIMDARPITPQAGSVMVFPHGCVKNVLLHEGSGVKSGCKYIIRTDVLYKRKEVKEKRGPDSGK
ncbi:hypothetical protein HDU96_008683 [Phlyctochytrium bullatum]|nr:hypothetical protein HDU96_008683 [Phlyctochytrium bullatum]